MPNIAYQVVKKILEFSFLNEKEIFSDLQFVPVSTIFKLLLVSWTQVIQAPEIAPALQFLAFTYKVLATRTLTANVHQTQKGLLSWRLTKSASVPGEYYA